MPPTTVSLTFVDMNYYHVISGAPWKDRELRLHKYTCLYIYISCVHCNWTYLYAYIYTPSISACEDLHHRNYFVVVSQYSSNMYIYIYIMHGSLQVFLTWSHFLAPYKLFLIPWSYYHPLEHHHPSPTPAANRSGFGLCHRFLRSSTVGGKWFWIEGTTGRGQVGDHSNAGGMGWVGQEREMKILYP